MKNRFFTRGLAILPLVICLPMVALGADALPAAKRLAVRPLAEIARHQAPAVDREALDREDLDRREQGLPFRFAQPQDVSLTPDGAGTWETLPGGRSLWRLRIFCPDVLSLNLGFTRFWLPVGARLLFYPAADQDPVQLYDETDNADHGQLWTGVLLTDEAVIELEVDTALRWQVELELTSIGRGYRLFGEYFTEKSGYCNVDVVCEEGDDWRDEIDTVGAYSTGGSLFCTGFMINNTDLDGKPYFMTAYHCDVRGNLPASLVVYWNFQKPGCRVGSGPLTQFQNGATLRAEYSVSDMALLELDDLPDPDFNVKYAGWNRGAASPSSAVCIHHPSGDEKSISFENDPVTVTSYQNNPSPGDGTHLRVDDWDVGTTEPGSSGSPLFDQDHRVVGQLHGGGAACGNNLPDWYGRFFTSWSGGGTPATQLSSWLDPQNTGAQTVDTIDPFETRFSVTPLEGFQSSGYRSGPFTPEQMVYTISNTGEAVAQFTAEVLASWLTVAPTSGSIPVGGSVDVTVAIDESAENLSEGRFESTLEITNTDSGSGTTSRPVVLTVQANDTSFEVSPDEGFESFRVHGAPFEPDEKVYTLSNSGLDMAQFTAEVSVSWLTVTPASGSIPIDGSTEVIVSLGNEVVNLGVGRYRATLQITNIDGGPGTTSQSIVLSVVDNVPRITGVVPNPFGSQRVSGTRIRFTLADQATVTGQIFDLRGQRIKDLGSMLGTAGENYFPWNGTDHLGRAAPSGKYIFILKALGVEERTNIVLIR